MAQTKKGPARPCRIFLCYRENTAAIANVFKQTMEDDPDHKYGNIWYSDSEGYGNFKKDPAPLMQETEWVIFFVGKTFTGGFLDEDKETRPDVATAIEMTAIERERQKREKEGRELKMLSININGCFFDPACASDLRHLFRNAGILEPDSVITYTGLNQIPLWSRNVKYRAFIEEHIAPYCALPPAQAVDAEPAPKPEPKKESKQEPLRESKKTEAASAVTIQIGSVTEHWGEMWKDVVEPLFNASKTDSPAGNEPAVTAPKTAKWKLLENSSVLFGSYPQTAEGKRQPIEWLVLKREADRALLISRYALDAKPYNHTLTTTTWAECSLQSWLTGRRKEDFPQAAFTAAEREWILQTPVPADRNPFYGTTPGKPTKDKVFLLSIPEAKALFSSDEARRCAPTDYAKNQGANTDNGYKAEGKPSCWWWLRSPGRNSNCAVCVNCGGSVSEYGDYVDYAFVGVRPALWVKL